MGRKLVVLRDDGSEAVLEEILAPDEQNLHDRLRLSPGLLPIEDLDLDGPLLVVGQEVSLASGRIDLVGLARGGDILLVEFKTGPQNPDFRHVLAQLVDYGSDLWEQSLDEFDNTVVRRYLASKYCTDPNMVGARSLEDARARAWPEMSDSEASQFRARVTETLETGDFHFVAVAQRFTTSMENSVRYLNQSMKRGSFYLAELIRYQSTFLPMPDQKTISAYACQIVARPERRPVGPSAHIGEADLLDSITDNEYRLALERIFDACRGVGLRFDWGTKGASIRLPTQDRAEPLSIAWIFPPDSTGNWSGLSHLTLGYDKQSLASRPSVKTRIEQYGEDVHALPGGKSPRIKLIVGATFDPSAVVAGETQLTALITETVASINEAGRLA
ncbi:hypothetical protein E1263_15635 [Kribbella antibiotica]|uniref:DUF91 domain-containing protein n=1 Tax=Kribbella antibiotica TaxID=190195 RepID=A0A4R4ZN28_9ACTN|nr:hypothetical protein [Kribbella antibiotica]TDD59344.1 hypothetical protein E1263_15635 [Kribbella antibiotica]